jgi:phospholipid/cholesterol/gamma-HCH transport system substrate-binding protein
MPRERGAELKVGLLVLAALAVAAVGIFLIGEEAQLFARKNRYYSEFLNVSGLRSGGPVQLNGVDVGKVESVILPEDMGESLIRVWLSVDRRYADRVRADSQAKIKTLGLLGDRFVEITSGTPQAAVIPDGGQIPAAPATNVDQLIASGEDTMDNVVAISSSLRTILDRMERGEGLAGRLTTEEGAQLSDSILKTMRTVERVAKGIEAGEGPLGRLIHDRELADRLAGAVSEIEGLIADARGGDGLVPKLLNDRATVERFDSTLAELQGAATDLRRFVDEVEGSDGLAQKLLTDEAYAEEVSAGLRQLVERLNSVAGKLDSGEGTAAKLIEDPEVYEALNDIIVGVNESRFLRWLIRNRQKKGIEERYEEAIEGEAEKSREGGDAPVVEPVDEPGPAAEPGAATPPEPPAEARPGA